MNKVNWQQVLKSGSIVLASKVIGALLGFIASLVITNNSELNDSGDYFFYLSALAILSAVTLKGTGNLVVKIAAIQEGTGSSVLALANQLKKKVNQLFFVLGAVLLAIVFFVRQESTIVVLALLIAIPLLNSQTLVSHYYQGIQKVYRYSIVNLMLRTLVLVMLLVLLGLQFSLNDLTLIIGYTLCLFVSFILIHCILRLDIKSNTSDEVEKRSHEFTDLEAQTNRFWLSSVMSIILLQGGVFLAGIFSDSEQVAVIGAALRYAFLLSFLLQALNIVIAPNFAKYSDKEPSVISALYRKSVLWLLCLSAPFLVLLVIYAEFFMSLFGQEFAKHAIVLQVLLVGQFVKVAVGSVGQLLNMTGNEKYQTHSLVLSAFSLVVASFLLIPLYGALGAAIAISVSVCINNLLGVFFVAIKTPYIFDKEKA